DALALPPDLVVSGEAVRYEVTMEPNRRPWLFLLEAAPQAPEVPGVRVRMTRELQWLTDRPIGTLVRYTAQSHTSFRHGPLEPAVALQDHIELPPGFNPRTLALAQDLRRQHGSNNKRTHGHCQLASSVSVLSLGIENFHGGFHRSVAGPRPSPRPSLSGRGSEDKQRAKCFHQEASRDGYAGPKCRPPS
ncbi:MAG: DUF3488 domain-containing protein, partial [Hydrogenophaga sp.]